MSLIPISSGFSLSPSLALAAAYWSVLQPLLRAGPLTATELVVVVVCSLAPVAVVEVVKLLRSPGGERVELECGP